MGAGGFAGWAFLAGAGDWARPRSRIVLPPDVAAPAFRVVYRVEDKAGPETRVLTDVLEVRRPFEARLEHRNGPPPGDEAILETVVNGRFSFTLVQGKEQYGTLRAPSPLLPQTYSIAALEGGVAAGVADEGLGEGRVLGQACRRFGFRQAGNDPLAKGDPVERVDVCVTPDGILLKETIVIDGRQVRSAEAVDLERSPSFAPERFLSGRVPQNLVKSPVDESRKAPKGGKWVDVAVPDGFFSARRVIVNRSAPEGPSRPVFVEAFARGSELVVLEQSLAEAAGSPWPADEGVDIDLGRNQRARVVYRPASVEVRMSLGGKFVQVSATSSEHALVMARGLRRS